MFEKVVEEGLTYGQAIDKCIHEKKMISRPHWGGYWFAPESHLSGWEKGELTTRVIMQPMIVARLKDNAGYVPATPYTEDVFATDWRVVE